MKKYLERVGDMETPIIEVRDLWFEYPGRVVALRGINLKIHRGEFLGIIGHNGSGKTTLVKHFNGLLKPTKGLVLVDGIDTRKLSVAQLSRKVGYVFQNPDHQIFAPTILEEVGFGLKNSGVPESEIIERVKEALQIVDLNKPLDASPHFLSVGEKHRLAIASVLVTRPEVIILDEPTTGLDFKHCIQLMSIVKKLNERGHTIILVTHDMYLIAEFTRRVIVLREGRIVADGSTKSIMSNIELLEENFLYPPQVTLLARAISKYGIPPNIVTTEEFVTSYGNLLSRLSTENPNSL
ncbi:MAG: ABC transporter ATP-binding protein [Thermoprotei archaeon]|nr:MAG: ABC transporter ATP-binding protein [Thermoprotei archaeon]